MIPFLVVGDAPFRPTGLSRILTDLVEQISLDTTLSAIDLGVVGHQPWGDLPTTGVPHPFGTRGEYVRWKQWAFADLSHWGREAIATAYRSWYGHQPGVILSIWDPARCFPYLDLDLPVEKWGYFAVDAHNLNGTISGPAARAIQGYDRVLAYGAYGQSVLQGVVSPALREPVAALPHGYWPERFTREMTAEEQAWGIRRLFPEGHDGRTMVVGCVATNQRRKDLGLFCQVIRDLRARDLPVRGWIHTDKLVGDAWSIPQLAADCDLVDHLIVTTEATDRELAICYSLCAATIAPGRGEGAGFPLIESQACGTRVAHVEYAGGVDYLVDPRQRVGFELLHAEGAYGLLRPIVDPRVMADHVALWLTQPVEPLAEAAFATALSELTAQQFAWPAIWPQWRQWIAAGLDHVRGDR